MTAQGPVLPDENEIADSWAVSVTDRLERSRRTAWLVAAGFGALALLLAIALVLLLPLKTTVPYTLLVDRQTGHVEALAPLERETVAPDAALTRSFLVQYVIARESFDIDSLQDDYRKVALWSTGEARSRYLAQMQANNPASPLSYLPKRATVRVEIASVSSLAANRSLVRFTTVRADPGGQQQPPQHWAAVVSYRFSGAEMSAADRLLNPLGFQVTRYRRDAETLPEQPPAVLPPARAVAPAAEPLP
jgi:type IV secretion system protein VirB8